MQSTIHTENVDPTTYMMESTSSWQKLRRRIAALLVVKDFLKTSFIFSNKLFTVEDLKRAEDVIIKFIQNKYYCVVINKLNNNQTLPKQCVLRKLRPFLDNSGILRVGGRLVHSDLEYYTKHPTILPFCHVSKLIVKFFHFSLGHLGRETVLARLRTKFWTLKANSLVRRVCRDCFICRKLLGKPSETIMADLPKNRLTGDNPPFTDVAVDYFGPFIVSHGRKTEKRYGVIFNCLSSRAVHLEIAHFLTRDSFIHALRRLVCRRGNVKSLLSDNGTNFIGANKELKDSINQWNRVKIYNWCLQMDIKWTFNVPNASHYGGLYERQIRSIRKTLNSILLEQPIKLHDENLLTLMCEVEAILNNRPISPLSDDPDDMEALTPNHLLLLNAGVTYPPGLFSKDDIYVKRRWRQTQYLADLFWSRWRKEYIVSLQQRQKWQKITPSHKVGDLVLVVDANLTRNEWQLGRIEETIVSQDGCVRAAKVKISQCKNSNIKDLKCTMLVRPIVKLILLRSLN